MVLKVKDQQPGSGPSVTQAQPRKKIRSKNRRLNAPQQEKDPHTYVSVLDRVAGLEITGTYLSFNNLSYYVRVLDFFSIIINSCLIIGASTQDEKEGEST